METTFFQEIQAISNEANQQITDRCNREVPIVINMIKRHIKAAARVGNRGLELNIDAITSLELRINRLHFLRKAIEEEFGPFHPIFDARIVRFSW